MKPNEEDEILLQEIGNEPGQLQPGMIRKTIYELMITRPDLAPMLQGIVNGLDRFFQLTYLMKRLGLVQNPHAAIPHRKAADLLGEKLEKKNRGRAGEREL